VIVLAVLLVGIDSLFAIPKHERGVESEDIVKTDSLVSGCKREKNERIEKEIKNNPETDAYAKTPELSVVELDGEERRRGASQKRPSSIHRPPPCHFLSEDHQVFRRRVTSSVGSFARI
jgi:hypothetical protein